MPNELYCNTGWLSSSKSWLAKPRWWTLQKKTGKILSLFWTKTKIQLFLLFDAKAATTVVSSPKTKPKSTFFHFFPKNKKNKTRRQKAPTLQQQQQQKLFQRSNEITKQFPLQSPPFWTFVVTIKFQSNLVTSPWPSMFRAKCHRACLNR